MADGGKVVRQEADAGDGKDDGVFDGEVPVLFGRELIEEAGLRATQLHGRAALQRRQRRRDAAEHVLQRRVVGVEVTERPVQLVGCDEAAPERRVDVFAFVGVIEDDVDGEEPRNDPPRGGVRLA